jgi:hypothetical protein
VPSLLTPKKSAILGETGCNNQRGRVDKNPLNQPKTTELDSDAPFMKKIVEIAG